MTEPSTRLRLLVIEDDAMQSELVERALARDGFEVRTASTLVELRTVVAEFSPQLVLADVNMPDAAPSETVAIVRELVPGARVVLYSAWEESKLRGLARELGADGFISKSESVFGIASRLRALC
jgi:two-component system OmpR family response regulator